jgi:hypothetical protein
MNMKLLRNFISFFSGIESIPLEGYDTETDHNG